MPKDETTPGQWLFDTAGVHRFIHSAAAPDLYDALQGIRCDGCGAYLYTPDPAPEDACRTCKPARAALAKARGETPGV